MKLFFESLDMNLSIEYRKTVGLVLENPLSMRIFIENLWSQTNGDNGILFLSDGKRSMRLDKSCRFISNPYEINLNEKKIVNAIYSEMAELSMVELYEQESAVKSEIFRFIDQLAEHLPYPIDYDLEVDLQQLLKAVNVCLDVQSESLVERVVDYIRMAHQILGVEVYFFFHLADFLTGEEILLIQEAALYEDIVVIMIESDTTNIPAGIEYWIVDKDNSIIEVQV